LTTEITAAIAALQCRFGELVAERQKVGKRIVEDSVRHQQIMRDIDGCIAGAVALGGDIVRGPSRGLGTPAAVNAHTAFINSRNIIAAQLPLLAEFFGISSEESELSESDEGDARANMPRIADIIHDRLEKAGAEGSKAAEIRKYILDTYDADIHDKTVSMTLNRLQKEGAVRREGHTWFSAAAERSDDETNAQTSSSQP
jgi:hypothetical protein